MRIASIHEGRFMRRLVVRIEGGGCGRAQHARPALRRLTSRAPAGADRPARAVDSKCFSTGGHAANASNIARGTPETWRTCGLLACTARSPRGGRARGSAMGPGVPRLPQGAQSRGGPARHDRWAAERWLLLFLSPLPLAGGGRREAAGRGLFENAGKTLSRLRELRPLCHHLPQAGDGKEAPTNPL